MTLTPSFHTAEAEAGGCKARDEARRFVEIDTAVKYRISTSGTLPWKEAYVEIAVLDQGCLNCLKAGFL